MSQVPASPAQHLSADLLFHFLPQIYRRARAIDRDDALTVLLESLLRRWPLSGVLCELEGGPIGPVDLGGHPGLMLLYAERWARHEHPAWRPTGPAADHVELVLTERQAMRPSLPVLGMIRHA